jgi:hypothetical protein
LVKSWRSRIKITPKDLELGAKKDYIKEEMVIRRAELAKKYLGRFVSCYDEKDHLNILKDDKIKIIGKKKSMIFSCNNKMVGAVIRNAAPENILEHFGTKIKGAIDAHYHIHRGKSHAATGTMVGHGARPGFLDARPGYYAYKNKALDPDAQRIIDEDGNTLANWLYEYGRKYLSFATVTYEQFKEKVKLDKDEIIGAVFCTKNYEAIGHKDKDRSEFAVGYVYNEGIVRGGHFFYPEYGIAIELTSNSVWCWLTTAVHGTAKLDEGGTRYTAVISLTEKTAKAIEKESNNNN